ncbi:MAG: capsular polysaccharide synthesis protein [Pseudomonadota bacterium]|nr:capsular polysaccharide synthesis protein [Pseudomonadota bacterium]
MMGSDRKVFFYWHDGWDNAPEIVSICIASFKCHHPQSQVIQLDSHNVHDWLYDKEVISLCEKFPGMTLAQRSDLIRLGLLSEYGGIWSDSTILYMQSLDSWLPEYMHTGFFAFPFSRPNRYVFSNWFLFSEKDHPLLALIKEAYCCALKESLQRFRDARDIQYYLFHATVSRILSQDDHKSLAGTLQLYPSRGCSVFNYSDVSTEKARRLIGKYPLFKLNHPKGKIRKDILSSPGLRYLLKDMKLLNV